MSREPETGAVRWCKPMEALGGERVDADYAVEVSWALLDDPERLSGLVRWIEEIVLLRLSPGRKVFLAVQVRS